jgi:NADH-quinone oxidoreductase subunit N
MNWSLSLPEIVLAVCGMGILLFGVVKRDDKTDICSMLTIAALVLCAVLVVGNSTGVAFEGQFVGDPISVFAKLLILTASAFAILLSLDFNRRAHIARFEFPVLVLFATLGMMMMVSAGNMMSLYLGLELQSLSIYVLAAFARDDLRSAEAGLKYFVLGALASGLLLYGISLVYGFSGSMDFQGIARALADPSTASPGVIVGIVFVIAGLAFKVAAVPFHMWTPDVYEGAPTPVTAFLGTAPKVAAVVLFARVMMGPFGHALGQWQMLIEIVSIASMLLGALAAIGQSNIKRLMAYSSIGHMGYVLIGIACGNAAGFRGVLVYLVVYVFMNLGAFAVILAMRRRGLAVETISDLAGLGRNDPALALAMTIFMFSMAGIPPLSGFFGKLYIFLAAVQSGLWALAVIGVLTSVVGAFYYLRIIKVMYFDEPAPAFDRRAPSISVAAAMTGLFTTFFFVLPGPVLNAAAAAAKVLFG